MKLNKSILTDLILDNLEVLMKNDYFVMMSVYQLNNLNIVEPINNKVIADSMDNFKIANDFSPPEVKDVETVETFVDKLKTLFKNPKYKQFSNSRKLKIITCIKFLMKKDKKLTFDEMYLASYYYLEECVNQNTFNKSCENFVMYGQKKLENSLLYDAVISLRGNQQDRQKIQSKLDNTVIVNDNIVDFSFTKEI